MTINIERLTDITAIANLYHKLQEYSDVDYVENTLIFTGTIDEAREAVGSVGLTMIDELEVTKC